MTGRRKIESQRRSLAEIRDIMNSMKMLAYMETRKLARFIEMQRSMVSNIEAVAADFISAYPETLVRGIPARSVYVLVGSERGFCGDFNEAVIRHLQHLVDNQRDDMLPPVVVAVGHKLHGPLSDDPRVAKFLEGAGTAQEVQPVLINVVSTLASLQKQFGMLSLHAVWHSDAGDGILVRQLIPTFQNYAEKSPQRAHPPLLNLTPDQFLIDLQDHYLLAVFHDLFFASLMAENQRRAEHLEGAMKHLDDRSIELRRRANALRQEDIIEEIEVILLSASGLTRTLSAN